MNNSLKTYTLIFFSIVCSTLVSQEEVSELSELSLAASARPKAVEPPTPEGYTINYNTVSMIEYIRFASKICNTNFIFNENELAFTVTVVSDAPITPQNVMATLIQVLRIHGLTLLEQDNNLVIHKSTDIVQIATLVTENGQSKNAPIVTRIFRTQNTKPDAIAAIIRPMISSSALLEVSVETRQIILTDLTVNVDKVAALIEILDSPHTPLEIKTFEAMQNSPQYLIDLCNQIMTPIAQGNPFILVPQNLASQIFIVSTPQLVDKALTLLKTLDTTPKKDVVMQRKLGTENMFVYKAEYQQSDDLLKNLMSISSNLRKTGIPEGDLIETIETAKPIRETNSIMFLGSKDALAKLKEFLASLDVPTKGGSEKSSFFVYRPYTKSIKEIQTALLEMASNLKGTKGANETLIETIEGAKINSATNTIVFSGEEKNFTQIKELLATIDEPTSKPAATPVRSNFFVYKIQSASFDDLDASLKNFAKHLDKSNVSDEGLIQSIAQMKYIKETNSILFTGPDISLKRLQELVPTFDAGINAMPASNQFFIYKARNQKGDQIAQGIEEVASNLKSDSLADPAFVRTLESMKFVKSTNSLLFTGDASSIKKLEGLIATIDVAGKIELDKNFFLFHPERTSKEKTENYLKTLAENMNKKSDADLIDTIRSMKWIEPSRSFMFHGSDATIDRLKELLTSFQANIQAVPEKKYYIYKVQNTTGDVIEDDLDNLAKNFKTSGLKDHNILNVIDNIRYVKETNSLLLTGDATAIEEVKTLIAGYDYPRTAEEPANSNFFMYKPQHAPPPQIQASLKEVASNLKKADLADPTLLKAIDSAKYVETTNSLIFTGTPDALQKIQTLIKDIDLPPQDHAPIQHVGKTTFLLYKLKNAGGTQIITSIKSVTADLKKSGHGDKEFLSALNSMKYISETNSLLFTGKEDALTKVQELIAQFDVSSLGSKTKIEKPIVSGQPNFLLYKPQSLAGPDLQQILTDFADNLKLSGLADPDLFNSISSMRWVEATHSLVFTGNTKALDQVKELLQAFDVPSNLTEGTDTSNVDSSIQSIDNTNFLVYKLQFHKGDEIQGALRQIAKDLILSNAPVNQSLLNSINSIQWLEITNSLLCSGDQETLPRLKELIKSLDIPLKQVFIEMLIIETTLVNALQFGLEWGGNYKYKNSFAGSMYNTTPSTSTPAVNDSFINYLSGLNPGATPPQVPTPVVSGTNQGIGPGQGFDLGVIGEVIKHNGQTFLTLGSLLTAVQQDSEISVVMTPKVIAQDGKVSSIFTGQNIPFAGSFVSNTQSGSTIQTTNVEYRDIGMNLTITPVLGNSDVVTLDISLDRSIQEVNAAGNTITTNGTTSIGGITTSRTTMQTTVHVPDKNFLMLSGFVNNSNAKTKTGIPCLGGLPIVGAAFSKDNDTVSNYNIVIFLRPRIITSLDEMRRMTSDQEDFFRDQASTPYLQHNYEEGIELIKTVDDE